MNSSSCPIHFICAKEMLDALEACAGFTVEELRRREAWIGGILPKDMAPAVMADAFRLAATNPTKLRLFTPDGRQLTLSRLDDTDLARMYPSLSMTELRTLFGQANASLAPRPRPKTPTYLFTFTEQTT